MKKFLVGTAAVALVVGAAGAAAAHSGHSHSHSHTGYYHGPVPLPLPVVGHWPPGEGYHSHANEHAHERTHGHPAHESDYYGRITHIDRDNMTIYARSLFGLGPEWTFKLDDSTLIERWDGSETWQFSNLGRGQYVHIMYDVDGDDHMVKAMHVSWMAQRR